MIYRPPRDELYTIIHQREISNYLAPKLKSIGANFLGVAERTPYGNSFVSSNVQMAELMYESLWYDNDPCIKRNKNKSKIWIPNNFNDGELTKEILDCKLFRVSQVGNFTIPIKIGDTEIFGTVSAQSVEDLYSLRFTKMELLKELILDFRIFMHTITNEKSFSKPKFIREQRTYYISASDGVALEAIKFSQLSSNAKSKYIDAVVMLPEKKNTFYYCINKSKNDVQVVYDSFEKFDLTCAGYKSIPIELMFDCEDSYFD
jgi:hypothetical protein